MPSSRHHNEWLSLIEVSGPFLSVPVLERVFPQGLDPHDPEHTRLLKLAFEEWEDNQQGERPNPAIHREWINFVLKQTLGLPDEVLAEGQSIPQTLRAMIAEHGETLRPDVVVRNPEGVPDAGKARLLIQTYPPTQYLEKPIPGRHWKASPATRMMELLHATETRLGLVTNGNDWMLVDAPKGETTGFITWDATFWAEEPLTLRAFRSLLGVHRFFSVPDNETLEAMLKESASNQQEVTDRLGYQVREAVEVIIRSLDRIDRDEKGQLLAGVSEPVLYEAALTVMMRLVFLFSAEERGLLLLGDPLYDEHYAVSTLVARLQEAADQHGEEVLERRHDAWVRLLSTFRAVYGGVRHERLKLLPYAGRLFDPDRFPFLEGRRPGSSWRVAGEGWSDRKGASDAASELPRVGSLAVRHGPRSGVLPSDQTFPQRGIIRSDEPDPARSGVDPGEHRRGTGTPAHEGVPEPSQHGSGVAHGAGNSPHAESSAGFDRPTDARSASIGNRPDQSNALGTPQIARKASLNPPPSTLHASPAKPLPIDNRTVLHLLRSLQYLEMRGEARRLSFRALDIEQIGHVYEGLLDHTAKRATEPMLSLTAAKGDEPEVAISELEHAAGEGWRVEGGGWDPEKLAGNPKLITFLKDVTGRSESALQKALLNPPPSTLHTPHATLRAACGDERLFGRVRPFAALVRNDTFDRPVVIRTGSVFVTAGTDRRSTGTHYTPRSLTEPIVQYTLEPLVYVGPAEGQPKEQWKLRTARELLDLKICDMACGSGAFLVQACRYLSERLVEAWELAERGEWSVAGGENPNPSSPSTLHPPRITPYGLASTGQPGEQLIPDDTTERLAFARRLVAQRCLYGVDKNPLAVEMAKLSLWLLTLAKDKPFTFLDHAIRCGDSLVGISSEMQLKTFSLDGQGIGITLPNFLDMVPKIMQATRLLRVQLEKIADDTVSQVEEKQRIFDNIRFQTRRLTYAADRLLAASWGPVKASERAGLLRKALQEVDDRIRDVDPDVLEAEGRAAREEVGCPRPFHWALEFPEVFLDRGGFDAFVCNPPFMGGQKITGNLGTDYRDHLVEHLARGRRGSADLCAYFFLRAERLLREGGQCGLLATNTVAQGDTREVGLDQLTANGCVIPRAVPSRKWPGAASLEVAHVWLRKGRWASPFVLDEKPAAGITSFLTEPGAVVGPPHRLSANAGKSFIGSYVLGMGFVLEPDEARRLIDKNPRNKDVIFPYLNGEDLNSRPDQSPSRWVINFFDWPLDRDSAPEDYKGPMAADYPDCLAIIEKKVKPERMKNNRKVYRDRWWQHAEKRPELYRTIAGMERFLIHPLTSKHHTLIFIGQGVVASHMTVVLPLESWADYCLLQSDLHWKWALEYGNKLEDRPQYTPSDCLEPYPFPTRMEGLKRVGESYYEHRRKVMLAREEGATSTYNRFHSPDESAADIQKLRDLHVEMDNAVASAYGWNDLDLGHGFHETKQGLRFTISESARREVLARLLKLNHERYAEEVAQGLHDKKGGGGRVKGGGKKTVTRASKSRASTDETPLFGDGEDDPDPADGPDGDPSAGPERERASSRPARSRPDRHVQRPRPAEPAPVPRPTPIDEIETDAIMAAFRQAARGRGWLERDELLKEVSLVLGYQRLGPKIEEALRGHLRAAIRRRIIETDGPSLVRAGASTMADYGVDELREVFRSVMRKGTRYERDDVIQAMARYLGFVRVTDTIRDPIRSAITSAIRRGLLGYSGSVVWREE